MSKDQVGKKILIVEDDEDVLDMLSQMIKNCGYAVAGARNGIECMTYLKQHDADLIIMDIKMPLMDGITTLRKMKNENHQVPVIVYSGFLDDDTIRLSESLGAKKAYPKPINIEHIEDAIQKYT